MKKVMISVCIIFLAVLSSGCATATRTVSGAAYGAACGFGSGVYRDTKDTTNLITDIDQWIRKNMW